MDTISAEETARIYRALGELYLEPPTEDQVARVSQWAETWIGEAGGTLPTEIAEPLETLANTDPSDIEELETAFPRLFRGLSERESPDPPYESMYREGTIYGESTTAVRTLYREVGLDVSDEDSREPADHLGIELQFLGELRAMEDSDDESVVELEQRFIEEHIGEWIGEFRRAVETVNPPPFYRAVLDLTEAVVQLEKDRLH